MSLEDCRNGALHILRSGCPGTDADAHGSAATPSSTAAPARTGVLNVGRDPTRALVVSESDHDLIKHYVVQNLDTRRVQPVGNPPCLMAIALHELSESPAPQ